MIRVLTIDGGGIRGIIPAFLCKEIERRTGQAIHELFDLIVGTSTGGIIALGLVNPQEEKMKSSAEKMVMLYEEQGAHLFSPKNKLGNFLRPKYHSLRLEKILREYFGEIKLSQAVKPVMVATYDIEHRRPFLFKSWKTQKKQNLDPLMRELARATSAAPTYFSPARVEGLTLVDGGLYANNPSMAAYAAAKRLWPKDNEVLLLSLGTGAVRASYLYERINNWGIARWARPLINCVFESNSESTDYIMHRVLQKGNYLRLQCQLPLKNESLDNTSPDNIRYLKIYAQQLIDARHDDLKAMIEKLKS